MLPMFKRQQVTAQVNACVNTSPSDLHMGAYMPKYLICRTSMSRCKPIDAVNSCHNRLLLCLKIAVQKDTRCILWCIWHAACKQTTSVMHLQKREL